MLSFLFRIFNWIFLAGYINPGAAFPKPLSAAEEEGYVLALQKGSEEAREQLIVHNLRLCAHIAKKYAVGGRDLDDLISIGAIGLIKAVNTFSPERGALSGYASRCIENEILMSLRAERKLVNEVSMEDPLGTDREGNELTVLDLMGTDVEAIFEEVRKKLEGDRLKKEMRSILKKRERTVLELRYGLNNNKPMAQREVAAVLGISRSYISRIEKKALLKLRAALVMPQDE